MVIAASSRWWSIVLRVILGVNALLIILSFTEWFSGNAKHAGFADRIFRPISGAGFRVDFLYVLASGVFALVTLAVLAAHRPFTGRIRIDVWLCVAATFGTVAYVVYALRSGVLYFG